MKKLAFLLPILLGVIIFSSGCDYDLLVQEYNHIQYQGTDYVLSEEWVPTTKTINDKIPVKLVYYDSSVSKKQYFAQSFAGDKSKIFLFFDQQLYVKTGYKFPKLNENSDIIKIELVSEYPESYKSGTIRDKKVIKEFIAENLKNSGTLIDAEGTNLKDYVIRVYFNNYIAYLALGVLWEDKNGNLGFFVDGTNKLQVRLLSDELNQEIHDLLK